jgi:putative ABC transport system permease protein
MNSLVAANLAHRPGRTLVSAAGVAVGVVLVVLTVGLVRGSLRERGRREANLGAEILLSQRGQRGIAVTALPLTIPLTMVDEVRAVAGVAGVAAVGQHLELKGESGLGIRQVDGVDFARYAAVTGVRVVEGQPLPTTGDFMVVDVRYARDRGTKPGDKIVALDRTFTVVGVYAPETGARMMIPLPTMQGILGAEGKCSMLLVKCLDAGDEEAVARRITERFPDLGVIFAADLPTLFATGYGAFNVFLNAVAALAAVISLLVILLTTYTAVTERTRQIGILKALGASRQFIAFVFVKEALLVSLIGVAGGMVVALAARALLVGRGVNVSVETDYVLLSVAAAFTSALAGALFPALRAARQDAVEALSYE